MKDFYVLCSCLLVVALLPAQPSIVLTELSLTGPNLVDPIDVTGSGDGSGRLFVIEKRGTIRVIDGNTVLNDFFLDIQAAVDDSPNEAGLLGLAFHPDFPSTPYFYVNYFGNGAITYVSRFTVNPSDADDALEASEMVLLSVDQPFNNHNAGDLAFSPIDGYLYIPLGDGGSGGDPEDRAQDSTELLGKMLRIDVDGGTPYGIPPDNPYVSYPDVPDEIWAFGLRNPWRMSFDRVTGDLWFGDVGQGDWEEVNFQPAGSGGHNYGWNCYEANDEYENDSDCVSMSAYDFPIFEYPQSDECPPHPCPYGTGQSIVAGHVYRGSTYTTLQGYFVCVDHYTENLWVIDPSNGFQVVQQSASPTANALCAFGEGDDGELYTTSLSADAIYRVGTDEVLPVYFTRLDLTIRQNQVDVLWEIESTEDIVQFEVQRLDKASPIFATIGTVESESGRDRYTFADTKPANGRAYYRINAVLSDGSGRMSQISALYFHGVQRKITVETGAQGLLAISATEPVGEVLVAVYQVNGAVVSNTAGVLDEELLVDGTALLLPGAYFVVVRAEGEVIASEKWVKAK